MGSIHSEKMEDGQKQIILTEIQQNILNNLNRQINKKRSYVSLSNNNFSRQLTEYTENNSTTFRQESKREALDNKPILSFR